ncbi:MAG: cbb3-type cytochrome c oxidase N-terminal domain-containing protein [Bacteroidota bacterium]
MKILDDEQDKLLDHDYDGIKELDNHMPVWWLWLFYFTIAFGIGYLLYYQVFDIGPDQHDEYQQEIAEAKMKFGDLEKESAAESFEWTVLTGEEDLQQGKELFFSSKQLCTTCHGQNGEGMVGPNLTDEYWMHGCSPQEIAQSIINGYPSKGMQPYGSGARMSNEEVQQVVSYIVSLQGTEPANAKAPDMNRAEPCTMAASE